MKNDPEGACERLVKEAVACWKREDEVVDDITIIICFFSKSIFPLNMNQNKLILVHCQWKYYPRFK